MTWRIWLEAVPGNKSRFGEAPPLQAGWFGGRMTYVNEPIYRRTPNEEQAEVFNDRNQVIKKVRQYRSLGYSCRAVPPIEFHEVI